MSFVPSLIALSAMAVVAMFLTAARGEVRAGDIVVRNAVRVVALAILLQTGHFGEEALTGLNRSLPELFGLDPVSMESFVTVNVVALGIWVLSAWGLAHRSSWGLFPLWFLGVASVSNAVIHPGLALAARSYFPGLVTSPLVGVAGALLLRSLGRVTRPPTYRAPNTAE